MSETAKSASGGCTCLRLRKASRRISQIYDQSLESQGLTVTQFSLLGHLNSFSGISIGALAAKMVMDPTTLTRNLRPLERRGYVEFAADPEDLRTRCVNLTASGRKAYRDARPAWTRAQRHVDKLLGDVGGPPLHDVLDRVLERLAT